MKESNGHQSLHITTGSRLCLIFRRRQLGHKLIMPDLATPTNWAEK